MDSAALLLTLSRALPFGRSAAWNASLQWQQRCVLRIGNTLFPEKRERQGFPAIVLVSSPVFGDLAMARCLS
jgi:hypothetical protein